MKQLLGTWAIVLISLLSIAQAPKISISGKVVDAATQKPIAGATLTLGNTVLAANDDGQFQFVKVNKGNYTLVASSVGYADASQTIQASSSSVNNLVLSLQSVPLFLQPLEVKALRAAELSPFSKTNLGKAEIAKTNLGQDLPIILQQTPSTVITSDAGNGVGYTGIYIRGVDATRINVTLNGIPYNDAESHGTYFVNLPDMASSLQSIQIQRGVGSSSNGTGAFGAGINLQTNDFNEKAYAEFNNSYGSFNTLKNTIKAGSGLINGHFTVDTRLSRIKSDGFIDRASSDLQSYAISAAYINKTTSVRANIFSGKEKTYQAWYGVSEDILPSNRTYNPYTYSNQTDNYQQNHYQLFVNHAINKKWSFNTAFFLTQGKGYYEEYLDSAYYSSFNLPDITIGTTTIAKSNMVRQRWLDNKFYGQIGALQYKTTKDQFILGGGWSRYEGAHIGYVIWAKDGGVNKDHQYYYNDALKGEGNVYAKWEHQLNKNILFYTDLQYKYVFHRMNGFDSDPTRLISKNFNFWNPKLGITYHKNGWQVYASYAIANKEPNRTDFENALNNNPSAEHLGDVEIGFEKRGNKYSYGATLYSMDYKDQLVLTGKLNDAGYPIRINTPKSFRRGIELQGTAVITNWLNVAANLTLSSNKIKQFTQYLYKYDDSYNLLGDTAIEHNNSTISFSPSTIAGATINIEPCQYVEFSLISKFVSKQYLDNTQNDQRALSDYYTQAIRATLTLKSKWVKESTLIAQVNNVFDRKYESNGATYPGIYSGALANGNYYFPMAGINYMLGLNIKL